MNGISGQHRFASQRQRILGDNTMVPNDIWETTHLHERVNVFFNLICHHRASIEKYCALDFSDRPYHVQDAVNRNLMLVRSILTPNSPQFVFLQNRLKEAGKNYCVADMWILADAMSALLQTCCFCQYRLHQTEDEAWQEQLRNQRLIEELSMSC